MKNLYHRLLLVIAGSTQKELARQVRYLTEENQILRSKLPKRVKVTAKERSRLVKFGSKLGKVLGELVSIVHPDTLRRWIREANKSPQKKSQMGRPRTREDVRKLIIKLARENGWGYTRIMGEIKKLGLTPPSRNTVKNILKENGLDPGPKRRAGTWDDFLKQHAATLWQCDFYAKKVLTPKGVRHLYLLVFLHVQSRRVYIAPSTYHPDEQWVKDQADAFLSHAKENELAATILMHDRDTKFTKSFDQRLAASGVEIRKTAYRAPNTNAFVERFIQTLQQECLDYFIVFGRAHMDYLVSQMLEHYHEERPHQAKENELLHGGRQQPPDPPPDTIALSEVACRERHGGLLKHYYRKAA